MSVDPSGNESKRRGWPFAVLQIGRWAAIGLAVAAAWHLARLPRTVDSFALRLLAVSGGLVVYAWFREPTSLAVVGRPLLLPGDHSASVQRAALRKEIERAANEPPLTLYRLIAALLLAAVAIALLAWT